MNHPIESPQSAAQRESHAAQIMQTNNLTNAVLVELQFDRLSGLTRAELARKLKVLQSTLCSKLHRMEQLDLIESRAARRLDPDTNRKVTVYYIKGALNDIESQAS